MITLRNYQVDLVRQLRSTMEAGARRILLCAPTGSGKTALAAHILASAAAKGRRSWFVCHRSEILDQSVQTFIESADIHTGVIAAGYPSAPLAPVQVCSVQTLTRRLATLQPPDLVVFDECQHCPSTTWAAISAAVPHAKHIGLSGAPQRLDGRGLAPFFDALIVGPSTADLIRDGYLSSYRLFAPGRAPSLAGVHTLAGDFNHKELANAMDASTVVGDAVSTYRQHCPTGRALVFAWSLEASRSIAESFRTQGVPAAHVDGETPKLARREAMRQFRAGELRVLTNVELYGEGLNVEAVDAVFLLRPTQSLGLFLQQIGRGLRVAPGKDHVIFFDHVNNWQRHGFPDDARVWSLNGATKRSAPSEPMGKRCAQCFAVARVGARACPVCGVVFPVKAREVEQVAGTLQAVDVDVLRQLGLVGVPLPMPRPRSLSEWQALGRSRGYNPRWAFVRWTLSGGRRRSA